MAGFYGYNPAQYQQDFNWIGDIGRTLGGMAMKFPELMELNREVKENGKFKEKTFNGMVDFVKKMDRQTAANMAMSTGIANADDPEEMIKQKLINSIPKPNMKKNTTNEDYAKTLINGWGTEMMTGFFADNGLGVGKISDLPLEVGEAFSQTGPAREAKQQQQQQQQTERRAQERQTIRGEQLQAGQESAERIAGGLPEGGFRQSFETARQGGATAQEAQVAGSVGREDERNKARLEKEGERLAKASIGNFKKEMDQFKKNPDKLQQKEASFITYLSKLDNLKNDKLISAEQYKADKQNVMIKLKATRDLLKESASRVLKGEPGQLVEERSSQLRSQVAGLEEKRDISDILPFGSSSKKRLQEKAKGILGFAPETETEVVERDGQKFTKFKGADQQQTAPKLDVTERKNRTEFKKYAQQNNIPFTAAEYNKWLSQNR